MAGHGPTVSELREGTAARDKSSTLCCDDESMKCMQGESDLVARRRADQDDALSTARRDEAEARRLLKEREAENRALKEEMRRLRENKDTGNTQQGQECGSDEVACDITELQISLCEEYCTFSTDRYATLTALIRTLPCYTDGRIKYDTFLGAQVIRERESNVWSLLGPTETPTVHRDICGVFSAYDRYMAATSDPTGKPAAIKKRRKALRVFEIGKDQELEEAMKHVVHPNRCGSDRLQTCTALLDDWMLYEDDVLLRLSIEGGRLRCEQRELSSEDGYLDSMYIRARSSVIVDKVQGGGLSGSEREMLEVYADGVEDERYLQWILASRAYMLLMRREYSSKKKFSVNLGDTDTRKDRALTNPMRHLAPGLVVLGRKAYIYGRDNTKKQDEHSRKSYASVMILNDVNMERVNLDLVNEELANESEVETRAAHVASGIATGSSVALMINANPHTLPRGGLPDAIRRKMLAVIDKIYDEDGEATRIIKCWKDSEGRDIPFPEEHKKYLPASLTNLKQLGTTWEFTSAYLGVLAHCLKQCVESHTEPPWNPVSGQPPWLGKAVGSYVTRARSDALAIRGPISDNSGSCTEESVSMPSVPEAFETPEQALQHFVSTVVATTDFEAKGAVLKLQV